MEGEENKALELDFNFEKLDRYFFLFCIKVKYKLFVKENMR